MSKINLHVKKNAPESVSVGNLHANLTKETIKVDNREWADYLIAQGFVEEVETGKQASKSAENDKSTDKQGDK